VLQARLGWRTSFRNRVKSCAPIIHIQLGVHYIVTRLCIFQFNVPFICNRILAPTTYIFFASALPVIAFGEQLSRDTGLSSVLFLP